ncbi:restriction endonuclease [Desulfosporosinus sp. SYSU MS00001]|uniref:restriction endonuclease n=1 Tax=Desulfosporosinus sp. SYSU MS00001 TaxID=3416284 RepID=UPI003CEF2CE5
MRIGEVFRYGRPYDHTEKIKDGLENYFYHVYTPGENLPILESGINPIKKIRTPEGLERRPAILISSSPHKAGYIETPWEDTFDPDNGHIRYYGDNKAPDNDPALSPGNKILIEAYKIHSSPDKEQRKNFGVPVIFFRRVAYSGRIKGNVLFQGYGIVKSIELITQFDPKNNRYFSNYAFDFTIFSLVREFEDFSWQWISDRRNKNFSNEEALSNAPDSWKIWIKYGIEGIEKCRRRVSTIQIIPTAEQKTKPGTKENRILTAVYKFYEGRKHRFEAMALFITQRIFKKSGTEFVRGWITSPTGDGGADFIGRLEIGSGFSKLRTVVLGQAKCEKLSSPTNGRDVARTVARLKRGWIGVYVTTSYFSESVQQEIIEDQYPLMLVNGLNIAVELSEVMFQRGITDVKNILEDIDSDYERLVRIRRPEEVLFI